MLLRCRDTLFTLRRIEGFKDANHCPSYRERLHDVTLFLVVTKPFKMFFFMDLTILIFYVPLFREIVVFPLNIQLV